MAKKKTKNVHRASSAKINLFLDVLGHRPDGYHQIRTIFSEIAIYDDLNFSLTENGVVRILTDTDFVSVEENLIYKVAVFIKKQYDVQYGAKIDLIKRIPISAGLGGGSSNAAQTIIALNKMWKLNLSKNEMHEIAAQFGSDVNFFLLGGTALGEERGEKLSEVDDIELKHIFLVNPGFDVSSQEAYNLVDISQPVSSWQNLLKNKDINFCYNKLEFAVRKKYPVIDRTLDFLEKNGADKALLSGSGPTMIGFCPNQRIAEQFSDYFTRKKYWNCITKTVKRSTK